MQLATTSAADHTAKKRKYEESSDLSKSIVLSSAKTTAGTTTAAQASIANEAQLVFREQLRQTLDVDPSFINTLTIRSELGYWRPTAQKVFTRRAVTLDCAEFRRCFTATLQGSLYVAYYDKGSMRQADIVAEIDGFVPIAVDVCMTALYAKLRNIHRSYGPHPTRYNQAPSYSKDIELPLPFALAIQEIGLFETHSMTENFVYVPTFPEGTQNEGRENAEYQISVYQSYVPTLRELGINFKSIDHHNKAGSPWWTYSVETVNNTVDLICTLPPSLYTDFSAQLRMLFVVPTSNEDFSVNEIITHPDNTQHYGARAKELRRGICFRAFLALSHCPHQWWTFY